jgi:hypothetical protein
MTRLQKPNFYDLIKKNLLILNFFFSRGNDHGHNQRLRRSLPETKFVEK